MSNVIDIVTIIISVYLLIKSINKIRGGSRYLLHLLFFVFYVLPLIIDYCVSFPQYRYFGFDISHDDPNTRIVYDICIIAVQLIICYFKPKKDSKVGVGTSELSGKHYLYVLTIGMIAPAFIAIVLMHNPALLFVFQWREVGLFSTTVKYYSLLERWSYIGITCSALFICFEKEKLKYPVLTKIFAIICLYMNICAEGKRATSFFAITIFSIILLVKYKNHLKTTNTTFFSTQNKTILISILIAVSIGVYFMYTYTLGVHTYRGFDTDPVAAMTEVRVDFFRDDRVRMVLYSEMNPTTIKVLDHRCQTVFNEYRHCLVPTYCRQFLGIPRDPIIYQHYFTRGLTEASRVSEDVGFMTVSYFDELIANFGIIIGVILFSLLCLGLGRLADMFPYPVNILVISSFVLLNMFDISYIIRYLEITALVCYIYYRHSKRMV